MVLGSIINPYMINNRGGCVTGLRPTLAPAFLTKAPIIPRNVAVILWILQKMRGQLRPAPSASVCLLISALKYSSMLCCWCGARVGPWEKRGDLCLIVHPSPLSDTRRRAALWEGAPAFRGERELMGAVVGLCGATQEGGDERLPGFRL